MRSLLTALVFLSALANAEPLFVLGPDNMEGAILTTSATLSWEKGSGRFGGPSLRISPCSESDEIRFSAFEDPQPLLCPDRFRIEAWLKTDKANVQVDLVLQAWESGTEISRCSLSSPRMTTNSTATEGGWDYDACDAPVIDVTGPIRFNLEFTVQDGTVWIDSLQLVGLNSLIDNGDFSDPEILPAANPTGKSAPRSWRRSYSDSEGGCEAEASFWIQSGTDGDSLMVEKSEGRFALSAEPILMPPFVDQFAAHAILTASITPPPALVVRQLGRKGLLKEVRSQRVIHSGSRDVITTGPFSSDPNAERLLCFLHFSEQSAEQSIHNVRLIPLSGPDLAPQIFLNQVGCDSGETLRFLVASTTFPTEGTMTFSLRNQAEESVVGKLTPLGRATGQAGADWGQYFFEGVIHDPPEGVFSLEVNLDDQSASVDQIWIEPDRQLLETGESAFRFFYYQRCGCDVPGWHGPCHLDDGKLPDGSHADLTGGYHNAGDFHKHMGDNTPVAVYAMASCYEKHKTFFNGMDLDENRRPDLVDEVIWGADWLLKMVDPKTGRFWMNVTNDIDYFGIPEKDTDGIVGTGDDRVANIHDPHDLGAFALAAWAVASRFLPDTNYLETAEKVWRIYESEILSSHEPRLLIASLELHRTTENEKYRRACERLVKNLLTLQNPSGWFSSSPGGGPVFRIVDEGTIPAALAAYALEYPSAAFSDEIRESLRLYYALIFRMADNPFGVIRHYADGEAFYFKKRENWFGGSNSAYCSLSWAASLAARVFLEEPELSHRLKRLASDQMNWLLGLNPLNLCMFEGKGNSDRIRFHHLYAEIPGHPRGAVPGAIPNGIVREPGNADRPWFDFRTGPGSPPGAESAEPWLPHKAYYLLALSVR